jgi:5-methylcytosine-specific restriction endonuclease McrA
VRWIEVDVYFDSDPKIERLVRVFDNRGVGVLVRLWALVARKGAKPGMAVDTSGQPFDREYMARQVGSTVTYLNRLLQECAEVGHIDKTLWQAKGLVLFPSLARRSKRFHDAKTNAERQQDYRERRFQRIADRDGSRCCRCGSVLQLELERKTPKEDGGSDEDDNLQIVCVPCGRKRRADRQAKRGETSQGVEPERNRTLRQNVTERDVLLGDPSTDPVVSTKISPSIDQDTHTDRARARGLAPASRLPLMGVVPPRPRTNPALLGPSTLDGQLPRDHLRCFAPCGRVCVPLQLHHQFVRQVGGTEQAAERTLRAFYDRVLDAIPDDQPIGDSPFEFWRAHFAAAFPSAAPKSPARAANGPNAAAGRVQATPEKLRRYDALIRRDEDGKKRNGGSGL